MQGRWEKLTLQMQQQYQKELYHLLLANLSIAVELACSKEVFFDEDFLEHFQQYAIAIDAQAREFHFRNGFYHHYLKPFCEALKKANHDQASTFEGWIKEKLPHVGHGKVPWVPLHNNELINFKSFFHGEEEKRYQFLKFHQAGRLNYLENNPKTNKYGVFCEIVLSYWRALKMQSSSLESKDVEIGKLLNFGESLLGLILDGKSKNTTLWQYALLLQELLVDKAILKEPTQVSIEGDKHFRSVLALHAVKQHIASKKTTNETLLNWLDAVIVSNEKLMAVQPKRLLCPVFQGYKRHYKPILNQSRAIFDNEEISITSRQKKHTQETLNLLDKFARAIAGILGAPPCDFALCVLGSTSRQDRRPYSDLELLFLYEPRVDMAKNRDRLEVYVYQFICMFELMIVRLGETYEKEPKDKNYHNAGFHLDSSSHLLGKGLWGTPQAIVNKFILRLSEMPLNPGDLHPWMSDESFYSLLQPVLVNHDNFNGPVVFKKYEDHIRKFLIEPIQPSDQIDHLLVSLKTQSKWLSQFKRHQIIAIGCLNDVLQKSVAILKVLKKGDTVDLKQAYYKPLAYLAMNLKLYYGLKKTHPADILAAMKLRYAWGGEAIQILLTEALTFVAKQQITLHADHEHQEEEMKYQSMSTTPQKLLWAGFDLITQGIILPLQKQLTHFINQESLSGQFELKDIMYVVLRTYLTEREIWFKRWQKKNLSKEALLNHPLIIPLETYPSANGWSPYYEKTMLQHLGFLALLTSEKKSNCVVEGLPLGSKETHYLLEEVVKQCFTEKGDFIPHESYSGKNSSVRAISGKGEAFYLKIKEGNEEGLMGREFAVQNLHLLLGGESQVALGWALKLTYSGKQCSKAKSYWVWISKEVKGRSLAYVMRQKPKCLEANNMDQVNYSQLFILSYLTYPEDGQPDNFKVQRSDSENQIKLVAIDMGQSFVASHREDGSSPGVLSIKTMIYLLENRNLALDEKILTYLRLIDTKKLYQAWQENLVQFNGLFPSNKTMIDIDDNVQQCVRENLRLLQYWVVNAKEPKTGMNLLKALEPIVHLSYQSLPEKIKTPEDFYAIDPKAYAKDPSTGKMYSSTTFKQIQSQTLAPEKRQKMLDLKPDYFDAIDFNAMRDEKEIDEKGQKSTFNLLQATVKAYPDKFTRLDLSGCAVITESGLLSLLEKLPMLTSLKIGNCPQLGLGILWKILSYEYKVKFNQYEILCPSLRYLIWQIGKTTITLPIAITLESRKKLIPSLKREQKFFTSVVEKLLDTIKNADGDLPTAKVQVKRLLVLLNQKSSQIIPFFLTELSTDYSLFADPIIKEPIAEVLAELEPTKPIIDALVSNLEDASLTALIKLSQKSPYAMKNLLRILQNEDASVKERVKHGFSKLNLSQESQEVSLFQTLENNNSQLKKFTEISKPFKKMASQVSDVLVEMLKTKDREMKKNTIKAIGKLGEASDSVIEALFNAFEDKEGEVKEFVIVAFVQLKQNMPKVVNLLLKVLEDKENYSLYAAAALIRFGQGSSKILTIFLEKILESVSKKFSLLERDPLSDYYHTMLSHDKFIITAFYYIREVTFNTIKVILSLLLQHKDFIVDSSDNYLMLRPIAQTLKLKEILIDLLGTLAGEFFSDQNCLSRLQESLTSPEAYLSPITITYYKIPHDINKHIFSFVDARTLKNSVPLVCKDWKCCYEGLGDLKNPQTSKTEDSEETEEASKENGFKQFLTH